MVVAFQSQDLLDFVTLVLVWSSRQVVFAKHMCPFEEAKSRRAGDIIEGRLSIELLCFLCKRNVAQNEPVVSRTRAWNPSPERKETSHP